MSKRLAGAVSVLMTFTVLAPFWASATPVSQNEAKGIIHGLEAISFDQLTKLLTQGRVEGVSQRQLRTLLNKALSSSKNEQQAFKKLQEALRLVKLQVAEDYAQLGLVLMELRQEFRQRVDLPQRSRQDILFLVQLMAEESLYVGSKKFSNFPTEVSFQDQVTDSGKTAMLRDFKVQTGDVILSKSTGFGSSSFIALVMDHPHIYSHSTPIYIDAQGTLLSPEAEIEDGVKLRNMQKDYVDGSKTRMFVYRYQGSEPGVHSKVLEGMENLVSDMYQRTEGDPFKKAAFKYDFSMTPGEAETRGLFCSSVAYEAYVRGGLESSANPYEKSLWSPVNQVREVLLKALNMNTDRVPAPGDLELNKDFRLVGARIDVSKLHQDRVEMAIIDTFLANLEANKDLMERLAVSVEAILAKPVDKDGLKAMLNSGLLPKAIAEKAHLIDSIPDSINLKQLAFFAFLNEVMTPKVRTVLLEQLGELEKQGRVVGPLELRKMAQEQAPLMRDEIAKLERKIEAVTGVRRCGGVFR